MAQTKKTIKNDVQKDGGAMNVSLTVKLPSKLRDSANEKSRITGVSISFVIRQALEKWVGEK